MTDAGSAHTMRMAVTMLASSPRRTPDERDGGGRATVAGRLRTNTGKSSSVHDSDHPSQRIIERFRSRRKEFDTIIVATYWNGKGVATEDFIDPL